MRIVFPPPPFWETPRHSCLNGSTSSAKNYRVKGPPSQKHQKSLADPRGRASLLSVSAALLVCVFLNVCNTFLVQTSQAGKAASTLGQHGCVVTASA